MSHPPPDASIRIVDYGDRYRAAFQALNTAWIEEYFQMEDADRRALGDPANSIIAPGGHILVALAGAEAIGVCALLRREDGAVYELAKMAVAARRQGQGVGEKLARAAIAWARGRGARRLYLESNTRLTPAIRLYRKLGFVEVVGRQSPYARSNIQMEMPLG